MFCFPSLIPEYRGHKEKVDACWFSNKMLWIHVREGVAQNRCDWKHSKRQGASEAGNFPELTRPGDFSFDPLSTVAVIGTAGGVGQCSLSWAGLPFQGIRDPSRHGPTQSFFKLHLQPPLFSSMLFSQTVFCPQTSRVSQTPWVSSHILVLLVLYLLPPLIFELLCRRNSSLKVKLEDLWRTLPACSSVLPHSTELGFVSSTGHELPDRNGHSVRLKSTSSGNRAGFKL